MAVIFPLSTAGKIVLIFIAIAFGLIFSMLQWPEKWKKFMAWLHGERDPIIKKNSKKTATKKKATKNKEK